MSAAQGVQGARTGGYFPVGNNANRVQPETPVQQDVIEVEDAVPLTAPAVPLKPRRVFVFCRAVGFVHSNIPLAAFTIKELGDKTGAWSTTISYKLSDFTAANLANYDAIVLDNTTGLFLDDGNAAATAARRQALINFVRDGKGLVLLHAAMDSYHTGGVPTMMFGRRGARGAARRGGAAARRGFGRRGPMVHHPFSDAPKGVWPAYNQMVDGWFKWHWPYPQIITVKVDDPNSPLTAMLPKQEYTVHDETYTLAGFDPHSVHILTSVDYSKMSPADKAKEDYRRPDGFYPLSWIHKVGQGRVFVELHGHDEHMYSNSRYLGEILAGIQYAIGDLKANDTPGNVNVN